MEVNRDCNQLIKTPCLIIVTINVTPPPPPNNNSQGPQLLQHLVAMRVGCQNSTLDLKPIIQHDWDEKSETSLLFMLFKMTGELVDK